MTTITTPRPRATTSSPRTFLNTVLDRLADVLAAHSITVLRVSLGLVFLVFASFVNRGQTGTNCGNCHE